MIAGRPARQGVLLLALTSACAAVPRIPVSGQLAGMPVHSTADSEIARYYLEHYLRGEVAHPALHARLDRLHLQFADRLPDRYQLAGIGAALSNDFAALFFAQLVTQQPSNRQLQARFAREIAALAARPPTADEPKPLEVIFVPAWLHEDRPQTGAGLRIPHDALQEMGVATHMVPTIQDGTVDQNAERVAETVRSLRGSGKEYFIVSVSKSGAEVAVALGELLEREQSSHVRAWVNIAGTLRGTPLADEMLDPPFGLLLRPYLWAKDWSIDGAASLRPERLRERFESKVRLPADLAIVNLIGVPLTGQLTPFGREADFMLDAHGPHDGVTLIADSMVPGRPTIVAVGMDHYFATPALPRWAVAMYRILSRDLQAMAFVPPHDLKPAASIGDTAESVRLHCARADAAGDHDLCSPAKLPDWPR